MAVITDEEGPDANDMFPSCPFFQCLNIVHNKEQWHIPAQARIFPLGEKATSCTQPPLLVPNSPQSVPNGSLSPQTGLAALQKHYYMTQYKIMHNYFWSSPLMQAEKTLAFISVDPAAIKIFSGCHSRDNTVERIGFLMCFVIYLLLYINYIN